MIIKLRNDWRQCARNKTNLENLTRITDAGEIVSRADGFTTYRIPYTEMKLLKEYRPANP